MDSTNNAQLTVPSVTGVDVRLNVAGPGARSYAFVVDWHIRVILVLVWFLLANFLLSGSIVLQDIESVGQTTYMLIITLPCGVLYFLYHPILELVMQGRSPGKRQAGIRIVGVHGEVPGVGAILIRNVLRLVDSLPGFYVVGLISTVATKQAVRIGDIAAGTLLVYEQDDVARRGNLHADLFGGESAVEIKHLELARELLARWDELDTNQRDGIAKSLIDKVDKNDNGNVSDSTTTMHKRLLDLVGDGR